MIQITLDIVAINLIFTENATPSAGVFKVDVQTGNNEGNVEIMLTNPLENDFVNFQLGEFMSMFLFNVRAEKETLHVEPTATSQQLFGIIKTNKIHW